MTQTRIAELGGDSTRSTIKVDWLAIFAVAAIVFGLLCLGLDLHADKLLGR